MKAKLLCVCVVFLAAQIYGISSNGLDDSTILGLLDNVSATNGSNRLLYSYIAAERNLLAGSSRLEQWIRFTLKSNSECKSEFSKCLSGVAYSPWDKSIMLEQYVTCLQLAIQGDLRKALEVRAEIASTGALAPLEKNIRARKGPISVITGHTGWMDDLDFQLMGSCSYRLQDSGQNLKT